MGIEKIFDSRTKRELVKNIKLRDMLNENLYKEDLLFVINEPGQHNLYIFGRIKKLFTSRIEIQKAEQFPSGQYRLDKFEEYNIDNVIEVYRLPKK